MKESSTCITFPFMALENFYIGYFPYFDFKHYDPIIHMGKNILYLRSMYYFYKIDFIFSEIHSSYISFFIYTYIPFFINRQIQIIHSLKGGKIV